MPHFDEPHKNGETEKKRLAAQGDPHVLDTKPGFFIGWLLYKLFSRVKYNSEMRDTLRKAGREGTIVYTMKYPGSLDYLLYHYRFLRDRVPYPKIAHGIHLIYWLPLSRVAKIVWKHLSSLMKLKKPTMLYAADFYWEEIKRGTTSLMVLMDEKGFSRRYVHSVEPPMTTLLRIQQETDRPIFLAPLTFVYEAIPDSPEPSLLDIFFGPRDRPGTLRKIVLFFRYFNRAYIDIGPLVDLRERLPRTGDDEELREAGLALREELVEYTDRQRRIALGPLRKTRQQFRELVLDSPDMHEKIKEIAARQNKSVTAVRRQADRYFYEIAANYNPAYVYFWDWALTFLWKRIFEKLQVDNVGLARMREAARHGTMVYVPCHRSHIDYLVLNYVLMHNGMHTPRIAAGKNLAFWPMGHIFRNSGAFFIRRTFRDQPLYAQVFSRYVATLLEESYPIEFFIEGGRSRSGKMRSPKLGFLSITLDTFLSGKCDDLIFVPCYIGYDHIMEEQYYLKELGGKEKKSESLLQMLQARKFLKRRYGTAYIQFAKPFSAQEYFAGLGEESLNDEDSKKTAYRDFAYKLVHAINGAATITPFSLTSAAVVAQPHRGFLRSELVRAVQFYVDYLTFLEAPMMPHLSDVPASVDAALSALEDRSIIDRLEEDEPDEEPFYTLDENSRLSLDFYKNSIIHHFIPGSFIAAALLSKRRMAATEQQLFSDVEFLRDVLQQELIMDESFFTRESLTKLIDFFQSKGFVDKKMKDGVPEFVLTSAGVKYLPLWAEFVNSFLESYGAVLYSLRVLRKKPLARKDLLRKIKSMGVKLQKRGHIRHDSALSTLTFQNAMKLVVRKGIVEVDDSSRNEVYSLSKDHTTWRETGQRLMTICRRQL